MEQEKSALTEKEIELEIRKIELEEKKVLAGQSRFVAKMELGSRVFTVVGGVFAVWLVTKGLAELVQQPAKNLSATARVIESISGVLDAIARTGRVFCFLAIFLLAVAWFWERQGKKRAIREKARYQQMAESGEQGRTSSGLTETGDTPKSR